MGEAQSAVSTGSKVPSVTKRGSALSQFCHTRNTKLYVLYNTYVEQQGQL